MKNDNSFNNKKTQATKKKEPKSVAKYDQSMFFFTIRNIFTDV